MFRKLTAVMFAICLALPIAVHAQDEILLGGDSIGIEARYQGVMISGTYAINVNGSLYDPKDHGVQSGDIIVAVNGVTIASMEDLYAQLAKYREAVNEIPIRLQRKNEIMDMHLTTLFNKKDQTFQSGLYVKDKITGVGTMTFYDPQHKTFGALGHEITDSDLKEIADIHLGTIYPADVVGITQAQKHVTGEKHASIHYDAPSAKITANTDIGIYGTYTSVMQEHPIRLPWAKQAEMHTGKAHIYTVLNKTQIQAYEISITKLHPQDQADVKGIEFTVTDPVLLAQTNGIIQGMSGSPIVQDGKIIGAITHVITSNPISGYGVYIEWMLEQANKGL